MKKLFQFKYPKLLLLIIISIVSYYIFSNHSFNELLIKADLGYIGFFIAVLLFSFGFSTPLAMGYFLTIPANNIFLAILIGGLGATLSDLFIFKLIRYSFMEEFRRLKKTKIMKKISLLLDSRLLHKIKIYLLYIFAGIIIASPLPDELAVPMLAGLSKIKSIYFVIISFIIKTLGIAALFALRSSVI